MGLAPGCHRKCQPVPRAMRNLGAPARRSPHLLVARAHGRGLLATTWLRNQFREALPDVPAMGAPAGSCLDPWRRRLGPRVARALAPHSQRRQEGAPKIPDPDVG